ncbi:hypothetical protein [Fulvivirga sedimenti]|uniref:Ligand-binding SRPBCC domain-containing protein n=1 Tax=Fulvivirga sedimenti TaxID=2879465 RepID=A0A9X1HT59_9BACT|nr:hypothetical protein [Fulvivirga sedimenti]MCA6074520.1 hypothetical protein [Fulvivirga sedimenti]MCA6075697.1 hypothetical protein [Fulvivirga sedimenti]MCA6076825.1 hypothetical protein [Fulvivirga sedimenti]
MKIILRSDVKGDWQSVFRAFDRTLFEFLLPPGAKLLRFDGSRSGDIVHLRFPLNMEWKSKITQDHEENEHAFFVDEGVILPLGLKNWHHEHHVFKDGDGARIEDRITFSMGNTVLTMLTYPFLYLAFLPRVWQYKKYFKNF